MGYADCNHDPADGCETPLNTPMNCGGCGQVCQQVGGTNACVQSGTNFVCHPTCDATHADCNTLPNDGCEVDTTGPNNCGGCGHACTNPHGTTTCTTSGSGWFCNPTCDPGYGACGADKSGGCTTNTNTDSSNCGGCGRPCSTTNATTTSCAGGTCHPTCSAPYSDCSDPSAPNADNGCETNGTIDTGETDNSCNGQSLTTNEGTTQTISASRILPAGDVDTFHVHFSEANHGICLGTQYYTALVQVTPPAGTNLLLSVDNTAESCNNQWKNFSSTGICVTWCGACGASDDTDWYCQVSGINGANSCGNYTIAFTYAPEGQAPAGCIKPTCN